MLEVDTTSGASRVFASGLRNPTGLQWEPHSGKLWAIVNERDEIGADLVPDYLTSVQDGGFYGWPYSYFGQHVDRRVQPARPDRVAKPSSRTTPSARTSRPWGCCSIRQTRCRPSIAAAPLSVSTAAGIARR